jgi:hypothetical protein
VRAAARRSGRGRKVRTCTRLKGQLKGYYFIAHSSSGRFTRAESAIVVVEKVEKIVCNTSRVLWISPS